MKGIVERWSLYSVDTIEYKVKNENFIECKCTVLSRTILAQTKISALIHCLGERKGKPFSTELADGKR